MKLMPKILAAGCLSACAVLTGCVNTTTYSGETSYVEYGTTYGIKVNVDVQGDRISKVTVVDSDYVSASPTGWDSSAWDNNLSSLLAAYRGKTVAEILGKKVATYEASEGKAPYTSEDAGFIDFGSQFIITGATLGSARLMLAVQNALQKIAS